MFRHKKYAEAGSKVVVRQSEIWIDFADAQVISEGEEITLMDWGNCIIKVKHILTLSHISLFCSLAKTVG